MGASLLGSAVALADPNADVLFSGKLLDPAHKLRAALGLTRGMPPGKAAEDRVIRYLDTMGYKARLQRTGAKVILHLKPHRVIRKIFIKGNWPIFEEEFLRRLRFRPGQRLPEGDAYIKAKERQEERMKAFLSREGYFDGHLRIYDKPTSVPHEVNLEVRVLKGRRYKVGEVKVERVDTTMAPMGKGGKPAKKVTRPLAVADSEITKMFLQKLLFYKQAFSTERFKEDVAALAKKFHKLEYPGVRIRESFKVDRKLPPDKAVRISLRIQQRKRVQVYYLGNSYLKKSQLDKVLTIFEEGTYDDYELGQSARALRRLYQSKGFLQVRVHFNRVVGEQVDRVTFRIVEGPRFRVEKVLLSGNRSIPKARLLKVIRTRTFPFLGYIGLGEGGYITDLQLKQDVERIRDLYREHGFPNARVVGELAPHRALLGKPGALAAAVGSGVAAEDGELYVRFTIVEGKQLKVENLMVRGNKAISSYALKRQLALKAGRPFTEKALTLDKVRLVRIYSERGYPFATIHSLEERDTTETRVTVQFTVQEGKRVEFGPIFIRGNFKTRQSLILDDLDFSEGHTFDIRKIEAAERALRKRELFNVVRVQPIGLSDQQSTVPILVQVEERHDDHGSLEFSVGGSTDNKVFGAVAYKNLNLLGFGTQLSLKAEYGWEIQSGNLHYRDPRFFASRFIFDLQGFLRNEDTERLGPLLTYGGVLSFSRKLLPEMTDLTVIARYEIRQMQFNEDIYHPPGVDVARQVKVSSRTGGLGLVLVWEERDNQLNPTKGWRLFASVFGASRYLGGTDHFLKLNVSGQYFQPLPLGMTLAVSVRYDHGVPLGDTVVLPKVERFYAGGDTTIRGFEEDMAWTEKIQVPMAPMGGVTLYRLRPQGGNIRLLTNVEFMFPIWKKSILFGLPLMGALFSDNGFVTNSFSGFEARDFRHGVGVALRIVTPVGFTSVAWAFALPPRLGDSRSGRLHFNFGFIF